MDKSALCCNVLKLETLCAQKMWLGGKLSLKQNISTWFVNLMALLKNIRLRINLWVYKVI